MPIADQLKKLRLRAKIHQTDLADLLKLSQGHISRIERGTPTTTDVVESWVDACHGRLEIVAVGDGPNPLAGLDAGEQSVVQAWRLLGSEGRSVVLEIAQRWETMETADRRTLRGLLDLWRLSYSSGQALRIISNG